MSRSRSVAPVVIGVSLGIVGGVLGWLALRVVRARTARTSQSGSRRTATTSSRKQQPASAKTDISDLVPAHVYTDAEPTALEAALRDALSAEDAQASDGAPGETEWIGNTRTLVLHRADSSYLPSEEHRQYFRSEEEALAAGYRRAANE